MSDSPTQFAVSVVIPTHNPRMDYLARVIDALRVQTLTREQWEIVVVDNNSQPELRVAGPKDEKTKRPKDEENYVDLGWHANARIVREEAVGLTNARLRGFAETAGEVIVLVDDDNVLAPDYLEEVVRIAQEYPFLGTWSGALELELEPGSPEPAPQLRHLLCERRPTQDVWSNDPSHFRATPWGAGECIRRVVATAYAKKVENEPRRRQLDLQGEQLVYGGDTDIAYTGLDLGLGMGVFTSLVITHLIPKERCSESYLLKHHEARAYSEVLHCWINYGTIPKQRTDLRGRIGSAARWLMGSALERKMSAARSRGLCQAQEHLDGKSASNSSSKP
jgi:glycosyltransferase involved in cell wall biosynthesis